MTSFALRLVSSKPFLWTVNETKMQLAEPEIARMTLAIGLLDADVQSLRQRNGAISREPIATA